MDFERISRGNLGKDSGMSSYEEFPDLPSDPDVYDGYDEDYDGGYKGDFADGYYDILRFNDIPF
jgi:hypothetical protein